MLQARQAGQAGWHSWEQPPSGMGVEGKHPSSLNLGGEPWEDVPHAPSIPSAPCGTEPQVPPGGLLDGEALD